MGPQPGILVSGEHVVLRDRLPSDVDRYLRWQTSGEWRFYDAPWEGYETSLTAEEAEGFRQRFLQGCEQGSLPTPRKRATITTPSNQAIGFVNRYAKDFLPDTWYVGIDICEDSCLNRGLGTEALRLWVQYLFYNSRIRRIGLETWSFNPRMMRVAEKAGFVYDGQEREVRTWQGERLDLIHYSILRGEWKGTPEHLPAGAGSQPGTPALSGRAASGAARVDL